MNNLKKDIKRIVALILTVAMIFPMDLTVKADGNTRHTEGCTELTRHKYFYDETDLGNTKDDPYPNEKSFGWFLQKCLYFQFGQFEWENHNHTDMYGYPITNYFLYTDANVATPSQERTSLVIDKEIDSNVYEHNYANHDKVQDWSELSLFANVTSMTMRGVNEISNIAFPANIKSLTIENCKFQYGSALDLSSYENLEELVITGTTLNQADPVITGLGNLKKLKKIVLDRSNISKVELFNSDGNVESSGLVFSANNCTNLTTVNTGKYMLINASKTGAGDQNEQYAPSFYECTSLTSLTVKGIAEDKTDQIFNINGCYNLSTFNISYNFPSTTSRVKVTATGVNPNLMGENSATFSRIDGSAYGLYILSAVDGSYLNTYKNTNITNNTEVPGLLFDSAGSSPVSANASYIIFKQDVDDYYDDKNGWFDFQFWKDPTHSSTRWRDYESRPIILRIGETIDDNTPNFYASDGTNYNNQYPVSNYSVKIEEGTKSGDRGLSPTVDELGGSTSAKANYHVISANTSVRNLKVTALNPGIAYLTVTDKAGGKSATQKIIVVDEITSMTLEECNKYSDGNYDGASSIGDGRVETKKIKATFTTKYPSLVDYVIITPQWDLYKKNSSGTYDKVSNGEHKTTDEGIQICTSPNSDKTKSGGTWTMSFDVIINKDAPGGEYSIRGKSCTAKNDSSLTGEAGSSDTTKLTIQNFKASGDELANVAFQKADSINGNTDIFTATSVDFTMYKLAAGYCPVPEIVGNDDNLLELVDAGSGKYTLKYKAGTTPAQIAKFLQDKGSSSNCYVKIVATLGKDQASAKTYTRQVNLAGKFAVSYDKNGGSSDGGNITKYYVPASYSDKYNVAGDYNLKPATYSGKQFMGWYTLPSGGNKITKLASSDEILGDLTLYAHWANQHTVTYNLNGGTNNPANPATFGDGVDSEDITLLDPSRSGYEFIGWTSATVTTPQKNIVIPANTTEDQEFTANWRVLPSDDDSESSSGSDSTWQPDATPSQTPAAMPTVPSYVAPGKNTVLEMTRVGTDGVTTTVAVKADGTVSETTPVSPAIVSGMNMSISTTAPTVINNVRIIADKSNAGTGFKVDNVTALVEAKTINGNVGLTPQMISGLKAAATSQLGAAAGKNIDIKVNTIAADGKPLSVVLSSAALRNNEELIVFARDPITGGYIMLNVPGIKYSNKMGLATIGLVSGLEYHYFTKPEAKKIEESIYNTFKLSDPFKNPVPAVPGNIIDMRQAISPMFLYANASKISYSVSGKSAVIDPNTGLLVISGNAGKGTITVTIKATFTNGRTKTIKSKIKIQ